MQNKFIESVHSSVIKKMHFTRKHLLSYLPPSMKFYREPFLHQLISLVFGLQFDNIGYYMQMGTGKTLVAINYLRALGIKDKILVVAPNAALFNWQDEFIINSKDEYKIKVLEGTLKEKSDILLKDEYDVYIINYDALFLRSSKKNSDIKKKLTNDLNKIVLPGLFRPWNAVLFDESRLIKNIKSIRAMVSMLLANSSKHRITMAGLPIAKSIEEIYTQHYILDLGKEFGLYNEFIDRYFDKVWTRWGYPELTEKQGSRFEVKYKMYKKAIRYTKKECLDLPEQIYEVRSLSMDGDQLAFYNKLKHEKINFVVSKKDTIAIRAQLMRFMQICGGYLKIDDDTKRGSLISFKNNVKLQEIENLLTEELSKEKVVIAANFVAEQNGIYEFLKSKKIGVARIVAGMTPKELHHQAKLFSEDENIKCLILSPKVGGRAINLTASSYCILYSQDFDYDINEQLESRLHRTGQKRNVTYIKLVCKNTIDEKVVYILSENKKLSDIMLDSKTLKDLI